MEECANPGLCRFLCKSLPQRAVRRHAAGYEQIAHLAFASSLQRFGYQVFHHGALE